MRKVTINNEVFEFDNEVQPLSEALEIERITGWRYGEYEDELRKGAAKAVAAFIWSIWRRNGRDVKFEEILDGTVPLDMGSYTSEAVDGSEDDPAVPPTGRGPTATHTAAASTSRRSARSASGPGK